MELKLANFPVSSYMTAYPIAVDSETPAEKAINFMVKRDFGNLIVSNEVFPKGILTEREILKAVSESKNISDLKVKDLGFQPYTKISPGNTILDAANTMVSDKSRLLVFDDSKLVGIITATDMLRVFRKTSSAPEIEGVISTNPIKCKQSDSILDAVKLLHEKRVGSIIIEDLVGYGIFTERDLLWVLANKVDLGKPVGDYCHSPLIVAKKGTKGNEAASIMAANNVKRLGIVEDDNLIGMITAIDLIIAYTKQFSALKSTEDLSDYTSG